MEIWALLAFLVGRIYVDKWKNRENLQKIAILSASVQFAANRDFAAWLDQHAIAIFVRDAKR